ncbi:Mitochondrial carnitine/acylcarnitine carrier-like protein [Acorus calamus]|uniref:Mitochondrial carnitine/acylcarnitine carrier-like protein n=1 Tax=Acorus calamus TaxID=4465 RepID=A0AAV9E2C3_ACOCL|nr:Mitochondrial carnitine/acylcarnitine carrier-like protein [Acorus calamus]
MVQGFSGHANYNGGLDVARRIIKSDGIRGLYRGFGLSVMTYSPSSAVCFLGYGTDHKESVPRISSVMLVQATGGITAGAVASCITTPLDTIKTRLQYYKVRKKTIKMVGVLIEIERWQPSMMGWFIDRTVSMEECFEKLEGEMLWVEFMRD